MVREMVRQLLPVEARRLIKRGARRLIRELTKIAGPEESGPAPQSDYEQKLALELKIYENMVNVANLPEIHGYWANVYVRPLLEQFDFANEDQFYLNHIEQVLREAGGRTIRILNLGSGNCQLEVGLALALQQKGHQAFTIECMDLNPAMLARGEALAKEKGVEGHLRFTAMDINKLQLSSTYDVVLANHALHHFVQLEHIFDQIKTHLRPEGFFLTHDMIGRNGHMRWPEALEVVNALWSELPDRCKYNQMLKRHEPQYINIDCSSQGFEGIRAQDILPLLIQRFEFDLFVPFGNVIDVFVDRSFGHNFDANDKWATDFIDRVQRIDQELIESGKLKPTHMYAAMRVTKAERLRIHKHLTPEFCVRQVQ